MATTQTFFISKATANSQQVFDQLLSYLKTSNYLILDQVGTHKAALSYPDRSYRAELEQIALPQMLESSPLANRIVLRCEVIDQVTPQMVRAAAIDLDLRIFSIALGCFLPIDPNLQDVSLTTIDPKLQRVLTDKNMKAVYAGASTNVFYVQTADAAIHFVNPAIVKYIVAFGGQDFETKEFSYKVADSLAMFTALYDRYLIPMHFYQYYQRSAKIINHSYFDIEHIDRKVFIKPLVFELHAQDSVFHTIAGEGSALLVMDKVRPGETLEVSIKRILSQELHVSEDFIAARVLPDLEFDRDRDGILTPRLVVAIFIDTLTDEQKAALQPLAQRTWRSA